MQLDLKKLASFPDYKYFNYFFTNTVKKKFFPLSWISKKKKKNLMSDRNFSKEKKYVAITELIHYTFTFLIKTIIMQ